jgi:hypothetical protein
LFASDLNLHRTGREVEKVMDGKISENRDARRRSEEPYA